MTYRYQLSPGRWPAQADDPDGALATKRFGRSPPDRHRGRMLGQRTVTYRIRDGTGTIAVTFAPDLGCPMMHAIAHTAGEWGLPGHIETWEVTAIHHGTPDPKWFAPAGRLEDRRGNPFCGSGQ